MTETSTQSLKHKAASGMLWTGLQKLGSMIISFGTNMLLARLISPSDFGCIGIILVFVNMSNVFIDAGFGSALIQKHDATRLEYSTVFFWNIFFAIFLYLVLFLGSDLIASFYNIDILSGILKILGLVLIFNAFSLVQTTKFKSELKFKILANCFLVATALSAIVAVISAFKGGGVWSLVAFQLLQSALNSIFVCIASKWLPLLSFSWKCFKQLFSFGFYLLLSSLFSNLCNQVQTLFIGKICSTSILGYYSQAKNIESAPTNVIYSVVGQVVFPIFSAHKNDFNKLSELCKRLTACVAYFTIPLMLLLILLGEPIIRILLSDKWLESVPYFQILCIAGIATTLIDISNYAIASTGASKAIFKWTFIKNIIGIIIIAIGSIWGIYGILTGVVLYAYLGYATYSILLKKIIGFNYINQYKELIPILLISLGSFFISYFFLNILDIHFLLEGLIFTFLYIILTNCFHLNSALWMREAILILLSKIKRTE